MYTSWFFIFNIVHFTTWRPSTLPPKDRLRLLSTWQLKPFFQELKFQTNHLKSLYKSKVLNRSEFPSREVKKTLSLIRVHFNVTIQMFAFLLYIFTTVKENSLYALTFIRKWSLCVIFAIFVIGCCKNVAGGIMQTIFKVLQTSLCKHFVADVSNLLPGRSPAGGYP